MYSKNIIQFLKSKIETSLRKKTYEFCNENLADIERFFDGHLIKYVRIGSVSFQSVSLFLESSGIVHFILSFCPELITFCYENGEKEEYSTNKVWLDCLCDGDLKRDLNFIRISNIDFHKSIKPSGFPLSSNLALRLNHNDYERIASFYFQRYGHDGRLDLKEFISKLGFSIQVKSFCDKKKMILGKTYFDDAEDYFMDDCGNAVCEMVKKNTIVVDYKANKVLSQYSIYSTLAHEASHVILHRFIRKLIFMLGNDTNKTESYNEMEIQANVLASYFLLPRDAFLERANFNLASFKANKVEPPRIFELLINTLSSEFKTSKHLIKKALFDLGYTSVKGIFECIDGHVLRSYLLDSNFIGPFETFSLSLEDLKLASENDESLSQQLSLGSLLFVENHLVLNNQKYVSTFDGEPFLTDYALKHLDECAYKFKVIFTRETYGNECESIFFAPNRILPAGSYLSSQCSQCESFKKSLDLNAFEFGKRKREFASLLGANTFGEGLRKIMNYLGADQKSLAIDSDLDETTISRYLNNKKHEFNKNTIVAMAIGMHLEPELSKMFLSFAGINLTNRKEDDCFNWALTYCYKYNVRNVNKYFVEQGYAPLTKEKM